MERIPDQWIQMNPFETPHHMSEEQATVVYSVSSQRHTLQF